MKRLINEKFMKSWTEYQGGTGKAAAAIMNATGCAPDTATKIARGIYISEPQKLIRLKLCELVGLQEDELFPLKESTIAS